MLKFCCGVCTFKATRFFAFPDDYWLIVLTTIGTNKKSNFFALLFSIFSFFPFLCKVFGKKCFEKNNLFRSYSIYLSTGTQFSKPFHPRTNSYFWYIERLTRYLLFTYDITKLPFIKPAFRGFKVIQISIVQKIFDIHRFFFKQWATYIDSRRFVFFKSFVQNHIQNVMEKLVLNPSLEN